MTRRRAGAVLALALAGPLAAAPPADWPTYKGDDARTGRGAPLALPARVAWILRLEGSLYSTPAVRDGLAVLGSSAKRAYGVDVATGAVRWTAPLPDRVWGSAPALAGGRAYVGCVDGCVFALSLDDGAVQGTYCPGDGTLFHGDDILSPILVDGDRLIFGSDDDAIYGFSLTGRSRWRVATGGKLHDNGAASLDGLAVVPSQDGRVYALGVADGALRWTYDAGAGFNTVPALGEGRAFLGASDGRFFALALGDGRPAWIRAFPKGIMSSPALTGDGGVVFGGSDGEVRCLERADGAVRWTFDTSSYVLGAPLVTGDLVWIGSYDGNLYVLGVRDGALRARFPVPGGVFAAPTQAGDRLLVAGRGGALVCLQAAPAP